MSDKELAKSVPKLIAKWIARDGEHVVKSKLIARRMSSSLVDKLCANRYDDIQGANLTIVEDELKAAGFISEDKAG